LENVFDDIIDFLKLSYPADESILIGCRAEFCNSYECCEYNIIVLESNKNENCSISKKKKFDFFQISDIKLKICFCNKDNFIYNKAIDFQTYINLTNSALKNNSDNFFKKKSEYSKKNFKILTKRKLLQFALDCTNINKLILKDYSPQSLSSYYVNMMSFTVLELLIQLFLNKNSSPSHLKYQINTIKEINPKIKEQADIISEYLALDRSNVSTITRSEKSMSFLLNHNKYHKLEIEFFINKLQYFKKKSMYVDANLLIHSFLKKENFNINYIKNYNKLLNYILDIPNKETIIILKELKYLFNIINKFIKNSY
jgi:hypothetical protein